MSETLQTGLPARRAGRADTRRRPAAHPGWALTALLGAMFLGNVDVAVANIAAPAIRTGLHASGGELELVVSGYTLAYAVLQAITTQAAGHQVAFIVAGRAWAIPYVPAGPLTHGQFEILVRTRQQASDLLRILGQPG